MKHDFVFQHMMNHLVIFCLKKNQDIFPINLKISVIRDCYFEFSVFWLFSDYPAVMNEVLSLFYFRIHHQGHEIVINDDPIACFFHFLLFLICHLLLLLWVLWVSIHFFIFLSLILFFLIVFKRPKQTLIPILYCKVSNSSSILNKLK